MQDVGAQDPVLAGQHVDHHLGHRGAIGEVIERPAAPGDAVPADLRRGIEAGRRQRHPRAIGGQRHLGKGPVLARHRDAAAGKDHLARRAALARRQETGQPFAQGLAGGLHRHSVHVGPRRGRRGRGVGHLCGVARGDPHGVTVDAEDSRGDLTDLAVQPLSHLGAAVIEQDRAVGIDMHQRAGLVQMGQGEGDAEFHRAQRDAALQGSILAVPGGDLGLAGGVIA
ncbi:hypothetical protein SDC9_26021 [bioreactor metagenome]|uniref:Uncharacterized protein n=1 Tax=bioreactor metagenome TaxID=1076179 RepID=A0A644UM49_9ZZZZ